mmetsp:Transcript_11415/g.24150  ORF Transcript_11415/g.24150 Transcript_11415/m.24150 type:complete len:398 (-) Transcript_11415:215-1408(-)
MMTVSRLACSAGRPSVVSGLGRSAPSSSRGGDAAALAASRHPQPLPAAAATLVRRSPLWGQSGSNPSLPSSSVACRADATPGGFGQFDQHEGGPEWVEVKLERVQTAKNAASVLYLSVEDGSESLLPVYVGEAESAALQSELSNKRNTLRPITYDLFKNFIEESKYQLTHVIIDDLVSKTYHATCYFSPVADADGGIGEAADNGAGAAAKVIELDSRPSDALNLAARFKKPVYVTSEVLSKAKEFLIPSQQILSLDPDESDKDHNGGKNSNGKKGRGLRLPKVRIVEKGHMSRTTALSKEAREELERSVRNLLKGYVDPKLVELQARLQVAVKEERYEDAAKLRDTLESQISSDRMNSVCIAMESAVNDKRFEEAAVLRNTFLFLKENKEKQQNTGR